MPRFCQLILAMVSSIDSMALVNDDPGQKDLVQKVIYGRIYGRYHDGVVLPTNRDTENIAVIALV